MFLSLLTLHYTMTTISNHNDLFFYKTLIIASFLQETLQIIQSTLQRFIRTANSLHSKSLSIRDPLLNTRRMTRTIILILMNIRNLIIYISIKTSFGQSLRIIQKTNPFVFILPSRFDAIIKCIQTVMENFLHLLRLKPDHN